MNHDIITAVDIAIREINTKGGVLGQKVRHIVEKATNPASAVSNAKKLLLIDKVNFIGSGFLYSAAEQIYRLSCKNKVIFAGYTIRLFPYDSDCPFYFTASFWPLQIGYHISRGIFEHIKKPNKTFAVMGDDFSWARQISEGVDLGAKKFGFKKLREDFPKLKMDYASEIALFKQLKPSFLFVSASGNTLRQFALQATELQLNRDVTIVFPFNNIFLAENIGPNNNAGIYTALPWYWEAEFPGVKKFVTEFKNLTHRVPSYYAAQAYTITRLILDVAREIASIGSEKLIHAIEGKTFQYLKGSEMIKKKEHACMGQLLLAVGKSREKIKEKYDVFEIIKELYADCPPDRC